MTAVVTLPGHLAAITSKASQRRRVAAYSAITPTARSRKSNKGNCHGANRPSTKNVTSTVRTKTLSATASMCPPTAEAAPSRRATNPSAKSLTAASTPTQTRHVPPIQGNSAASTNRNADSRFGRYPLQRCPGGFRSINDRVRVIRGHRDFTTVVSPTYAGTGRECGHSFDMRSAMDRRCPSRDIG